MIPTDDYDQYDILCDTDTITLMNRCREAEAACAAALPFLRRLLKLERIIVDGEQENPHDIDPALVLARVKVRSVVDARNAGENVQPA